MSAHHDLLSRLWTANAPQARVIWKEAKARGVHDDLKRAFGFEPRPPRCMYCLPEGPERVYIQP